VDIEKYIMSVWDTCNNLSEDAYLRVNSEMIDDFRVFVEGGMGASSNPGRVWVTKLPECPQQPNDYDCGICSIHVAQNQVRTPQTLSCPTSYPR
jgi:Ulp1 family protease